MNVLVTGASGLLGRAVSAEFNQNSWKVLGIALTRATGDLVKLDLTDTDAVRNVINNYKPHVIIHCAAERSPEKVETDYIAAKKLNVSVSRNLAQFAYEIKAVFVYISTDYVFNGETPPYSEDAVPSPINAYGATKLEGEKNVLEVNPDSCVLRIPILYGVEEYIGESAVSSLIKLLLQKEPVRVSNFERRYPSHTSDVAAIVFQLVEKKLEDPTINSVFHWCGDEQFTKYEMAKVIGTVFGRSSTHIIPDNNPSPGAARPRDTRLSCQRLDGLGIHVHTRFILGVQSFRKFFE
ncbi:methionine adenosyltransferase 2 subunit beta [Trichonephila inaurata madagascariensis]|uniref:Methionine adenosyltransferase 2 subunit beta n=1 Tax=Trichonephila inaurata madagascariensis TaxID=2747483 RepID=A0A8X6X894_9ARAC|nr:methionine adenosyltransferase 2 subunit beta [Trichonephila inaurata madagascariensis]